MTGRGAAGFESRVADWLSVEEAKARVLAAAEPLPAESVRLDVALGRALADDVVATATLPPWDNSAMDGYAVRSGDVRGASATEPVSLRVEGSVRAGEPGDASVTEGTAVRIMTGAPIPPGADTVVRVEDTDREEVEGVVRVFDDRDAGRHVRAAGQDMQEGATLLEAGTLITSGVIGVLAAAGHAVVGVRRAPRVAILSTGDELRPPERYDEVRAGRGVPASNGVMLASAAREAGAQPIDLGIARDDHEDVKRHLEAAAQADVLVTTGGASMGEADLVKRVLDDVGFDQSFWRVKMRPGSPISFGSLTGGAQRIPVFGLPGNPSSAYVTFEVFVRPFLLRSAGHRRVERRVVTCLAAERIETPAPLAYFQRVVVDDVEGRLHARLTGPQLSGLVRGLALAEGLAVVPPEQEVVEPGTPLAVMLLDPGPAVLQPDATGRRPS